MNASNHRMFISLLTVLVMCLFVGQLLIVQPAMASDASNEWAAQLASNGSQTTRAIMDGEFNGDVESQSGYNQIVWTINSTTVNITQITVNHTVITINSTRFVIINYMNTTSISVNDTVFLFFNASATLFNFTYIEVDGTIFTLIFQLVFESVWWFQLTRDLTILSEGYLRFSSDINDKLAFINLELLLSPLISPSDATVPLEGLTLFNFTSSKDVSSVTLNDDKGGTYAPLVVSQFDVFHDVDGNGIPNEFDPANPFVENMSKMNGVIRTFTNQTDATGDLDGYDYNVNFSRTINDNIAGTRYVAEGGFESTIYHENMSASFIGDALAPTPQRKELPPRAFDSLPYYNASQGETVISDYLILIEESGVSIGFFDLYIFFGWDKIVIDYAFVVTITIYLLVYQLEIIFFEITIIMYMFVTELLFVLIFYEFKIEVYITQIIIKYLWITITLVFISITEIYLFIFILWIHITIKIIKKIIVPWWWWWPWWWWPIWIIYVPVPILIPKPVPAPYPVPVIIKLLDIDLVNETYESNQVTYQFLVRDSLGVNVTGATVTLSNGTHTKTATQVAKGLYEVTFPLSDPTAPMNFTAEAVVSTLPKATLKFHVDHQVPTSTTTTTTTATTTTTVTTTTTTTTTITTTVTSNQSASNTSQGTSSSNTTTTTQAGGQSTPGFTIMTIFLATIGVIALRTWKHRKKIK